MRYSCDFSRHREEILHRGFRQLVSEILRGRNEMPGCCLQFQDFIRYCPSGRPAGRFAAGCFVFGCLLTLHPLVEMASAICFCMHLGKGSSMYLCPYLERTQTTQTRATPAATSCPVCVGRERARAMSKPERLAILCSFLNESGDYCISFIRMRPEKSGK